MKAYERYTSQVGGPVFNTVGTDFVSLQLSFSTADIEKGMFFGAQVAPSQPAEQLGKATILVVHGEMFHFEDAAALPQPAVPLTDQSGLFHLADAAEQIQD